MQNALTKLPAGSLLRAVQIALGNGTNGRLSARDVYDRIYMVPKFKNIVGAVTLEAFVDHLRTLGLEPREELAHVASGARRKRLYFYLTDINRILK